MAGYAIIEGGTVPSADGSYKPYHSAPKLRKEFYAATLLTRIMGREYEGMLKKFGDTVKVRRRASVTGGAYTKGTDIVYAAFQAPASVDLVINQSYAWNFYLEDLDRLQSDLKGFESEWQDDATQKARIDTETTILDAAPASVAASNKGLTAGFKSASINLGTIAEPLHLTAKDTFTDAVTGIKYWNAADLFVDFNTVLAERDIVGGEMFAVSSPWVRGRVAQSAIKDASVTGDAKGVIRSGPDYIGEIGGFQTYKTNLFTPIMGGAAGDVKVFPILFGTKDAWTFAMQVESIDANMKLEKRYGSAWRGLNVWGWKMMIPEAMGVAYVTAEDKA